MRSRIVLSMVGAVALAVAGVALADKVRLKNPGFETGNFANWKVKEIGGGNWFVYRRGDELGTGNPIRGGLSGFRLPNPPQGRRAAFVEQGGPGLNILHRVLKPKRNAEVNKLRFQLYYRNTHERFYSPNSFRFGGAKMLPRYRGGGQPNQQLRIDLLEPDAPLRTLDPRDIFETVLRTKPGDPLRRRYAPFRVNLTTLGINRPFRLRIAEVDNRGNLYAGVDALKLKFRP